MPKDRSMFDKRESIFKCNIFVQTFHYGVKLDNNKIINIHSDGRRRKFRGKTKPLRADYSGGYRPLSLGRPSVSPRPPFRHSIGSTSVSPVGRVGVAPTKKTLNFPDGATSSVIYHQRKTTSQMQSIISTKYRRYEKVTESGLPHQPSYVKSLKVVKEGRIDKTNTRSLLLESIIKLGTAGHKNVQDTMLRWHKNREDTFA
ncbi:hypothetical protein RF11_13923 [Thelohanellus kitauei]|uniref:Uncharacterized protein n=1 Tax=Thelohanellus kitauei TaxID=669202 RepID=A0A0C2M1K1_THEKT|nr:hypothetical protein RF11_13923 [Thelohanellus kitauei]